MYNVNITGKSYSFATTIKYIHTLLMMAGKAQKLKDQEFIFVDYF